jgi:hypothetical protein
MDLDSWLIKLKQANSHKEVFCILDEFRTFDWTDEQRSKVSKLYMRMLENLGTPTEFAPQEAAAKAKATATQLKANASATATNKSGKVTAAQGTSNVNRDQSENASQAGIAANNNALATEPTDAEEDGPVWYEKM